MSIPPEVRESFPFHNASITKITEIKISTQVSVNRLPLTLNGLITEDIPSTKNILKMLLPIRLPRAIPASPFLAAEIDVVSSGSEVPIATIVKPTNA